MKFEADGLTSVAGHVARQYTSRTYNREVAMRGELSTVIYKLRTIIPKTPDILCATVKMNLTGTSSSCTVKVAAQVDLGEENDTGPLPYLRPRHVLSIFILSM
jgi:hypothetical protein